jgi:hypothetical protein
MCTGHCTMTPLPCLTHSVIFYPGKLLLKGTYEQIYIVRTRIPAWLYDYNTFRTLFLLFFLFSLQIPLCLYDHQGTASEIK